MFQRYVDGECSPEEAAALIRLFGVGNPEAGEAELRDLIRQHLALHEADQEENESLQPLLDKTFGSIRQAVSMKQAVEEKSTTPVRRTVWLRVAAAVLIVCIAGGVFYLPGKKQPEPVAKRESKPNPVIAEIVPGGDKAVLTLGDGTVIVLDTAANGELGNDGAARIVKLDDGQLQYRTAGSATGEPVYNTMATPRGGQYKLLLPDGSRVWLNAASSIRYPTAFTGSERKVDITGEAYFEVAHNPQMPFVVASRNASVKVLGTRFNVSDYSDEQTNKTTLLEGSVKLDAQNATGNRSVILRPGEQASINPYAASLHVTKNIDLDEVMAWRDGNFHFNEQDIPSIMRQISRWYDVDVAMQGNGVGETFSGIVSRKGNITQVLKILEAGGVKFRIEGRRLTVIY